MTGTSNPTGYDSGYDNLRPGWPEWLNRIRSIARNGLTFSENPYDRDRYTELLELAAEIGVKYTASPQHEILDYFNREIGYATPKVDVRIAILEAGKVLLVREKLDGRWSMPGGWADSGLSLREAVKKEAREEAGIEVKPVSILAVLDRNRNGHPRSPEDVYKIFVHAEKIRGGFTENTETSDAAYFPLETLPPLSLPRITEHEIRLCVEQIQSGPSSAAVFD